MSSAAADVLLQHWRQCLHAGQPQQLPPGAMGQREHHRRAGFWQATLPTSQEVAQPKPGYPPAQHRCTPEPTSGEPTPTWSKPPHVFYSHTLPKHPDQTPASNITLNGVYCPAMALHLFELGSSSGCLVWFFPLSERCWDTCK